MKPLQREERKVMTTGTEMPLPALIKAFWKAERAAQKANVIDDEFRDGLFRLYRLDIIPEYVAEPFQGRFSLRPITVNNPAGLIHEEHSRLLARYPERRQMIEASRAECLALFAEQETRLPQIIKTMRGNKKALTRAIRIRNEAYRAVIKRRPRTLEETAAKTRWLIGRHCDFTGPSLAEVCSLIPDGL